MSIMNEEQKIIDLENEIIFLKDVLSEKQKEIEEKTTIIMAGAEKVKRLECQIEELLNVLNKEEKINYIKPIDIKAHNYISEDKIREKIEDLESLSKNINMQPSIYNYEIDLLKELLEEN